MLPVIEHDMIAHSHSSFYPFVFSLPNQISILQSLPHYIFRYPRHLISRLHFTDIVPSCKFVHVSL